MFDPNTTLPQTDTLTVSQEEAARITGLSAKTLERHAAAGEPVGRVKIGRRVLYVRARLEQWLTSLADASALPTN